MVLVISGVDKGYLQLLQFHMAHVNLSLNHTFHTPVGESTSIEQPIRSIHVIHYNAIFINPLWGLFVVD